MIAIHTHELPWQLVGVIGFGFVYVYIVLGWQRRCWEMKMEKRNRTLRRIAMSQHIIESNDKHKKAAIEELGPMPYLGE